MGWTEVVVDIGALRKNLGLIRERVEGKLYAVVKSNAYGHGITRCSRVFLEEGADALAVFSPSEGGLVRRFYKGEVLLLGGFLPEEVGFVFDYKLTPSVGSFWMLEALEREATFRRRLIEVHLKIDTGMGRLGFVPEQWERLKSVLLSLKRVKAVGVMSHFPVADEPDEDSKEFTLRQIEVFRDVVAFFADVGVDFAHIANSAGVLFYPEAAFDGARVGIALYGGIAYPGLRQAMQVRTKLLGVKTVPEGWSISYGRTYVADRKKRVGIIPCGYATGFLRSLSNRAEVLVNGKRCRVLGRICMDLTVVDLDGVEAREGDWVYILGGEGDEAVSVFECAEWMGTITYEVFCLLSMGASSFLYVE